MPIDLALAVTTFPRIVRGSIHPPREETETLRWDEIVRRCAEPLPWPLATEDVEPSTLVEAVHSLPAWTLARFRSSATREVVAVSGLVLDFGSVADASPAELRELFGRWRFVAHTTTSHLRDKFEGGSFAAGPLARWRVLLPYKREVTMREQGALVRWAIATGGRWRWSREVAMPWRQPVRRDDRYEWFENPGDIFDPDVALAHFDAEKAERKAAHAAARTWKAARRAEARRRAGMLR
jgi:hypothetical protein